jgi:hypothetical protein
MKREIAEELVWLDSAPYPRLVLSQNLLRQGERERRKATLYLYRVQHEIVLDGRLLVSFHV